MAEPRLFDLNIKKILEAWDNRHAVRELIANALDEQVLSASADVDIFKGSDGCWFIRDYGRGLRYEHFTQNESHEKLEAVGRVIGKFGVGLKDALATFHRSRVGVEIESAHGVISLVDVAKHGFREIVTLHAAVSPPRDPDFVGTLIRIIGLSDDDMAQAKNFFLRFNGEAVLEETKVGSILAKGATSRIYVAGLLVAEEENFAFSYNITSLTESMKKALNRERTNVGRAAYTERVKAMLLQTRSSQVARALADQLTQVERGTASDEVGWKDVTVHACKILAASGRFLFVANHQSYSNPNAVDHARADGLQVVAVPDSIIEAIRGMTDVSGAPIRDISVYETEWNDSFVFAWIEPREMDATEMAIFAHKDQIASLVGGLPPNVRGIRVSTTMRVDFTGGSDALGLWDPETSSIVIRRDQLKSLSAFAGVLLHEVAHARSGFGDMSRDFESELTDYLGLAAAAALGSREEIRHGTSPKKSFWSRWGSR